MAEPKCRVLLPKEKFQMSLQASLSRCVVSGLVTVAFACSAPAVAAQHAVPFKATVRTQEVLYPDPSACVAYPFLVGATTGTGTASHLGAVTLVATDCITPGMNTFTFSGGKLTLTAANGDELNATYNGLLQPLANTAPYTLYSISGNLIFTGGTGRFVGATGSGYLGGTENIKTGQGQFEVTATLNY
jgi:hypothetical protein